jgi:hypothetical protein
MFVCDSLATSFVVCLAAKMAGLQRSFNVRKTQPLSNDIANRPINARQFMQRLKQ